MIHYTLSSENPSAQYIQISMQFEPTNVREKIQLPSWRPGRYELGNFAKNVKGFRVLNEKNEPLSFRKITKDCWEVETNHANIVRVEYHYYASDLNAGSTYLSEDQLYVNPVNCCVFVAGREGEEVILDLKIPDDYVIASSMEIDKHTLFAQNFDELADAPFICSNSLQHNSYVVDEVIFHVWFQGEVKVDWEKLIPDFTAFTEKQIEKFGSFPVEEYHFLTQIVPFRAYHGVEHSRSTVLLLGPSYAIFKEAYKDLLGVSSHELYHTWNVKAIRPIEMFPYDFTKENYSELGLLCEGVTTYMGDLFLYKSGVFDLKEYLNEMNTQLQKHFDNPARFNYSVAQSSFDTWLDGYVPGAPNRKVSIYTEGCLLSFVFDVLIIKNSENKHSLDDVMKYLYEEFYQKSKGVSELDYQQGIAKFAGTSIVDVFEKYVHGTFDYTSILHESFDTIGLKMITKQNDKLSLSKFGMKSLLQGNYHVIKSIHPNSPAENAGLMLEDELIAVNGMDAMGNIDAWLNYFINDNIELLIRRKGVFSFKNIALDEQIYYPDYLVIELDNKTEKQKKYFESWSN
jgi:predicted metalloprotease with PDZ domain